MEKNGKKNGKIRKKMKKNKKNTEMGDAENLTICSQVFCLVSYPYYI